MVANRAKKPRTFAGEEFDIVAEDKVIHAIEKLQELQDELEKVNEEAHEQILAIEQKYNEKREPVYRRRNEIINSIPDFWLTTIFRYLDSINVEDYKDLRNGYCITFNLKANPYFKNTKLNKTINFSDEGTLRSIGTTINWKDGKGPVNVSNDTRKGNKRPLPVDSFFSWFSYPKVNQAEVEQDLVAQIIKEEMWPNPIEHLNNEDDDDDYEDEDDEEEEEDEDEEDNKGKDDE